MKIEDGTGSGKEVKVDNDNRLHVHSFTVDIVTATALIGDAFSIYTDNITLTSANESALIYIKNNETDDILISFHAIRFGNSANGTGPSVITMYFNPTGGTVVSDATEAGQVNRKVGDANTLTADTFKGAEAKTLTGGTTFAITSSSTMMTTPISLPQGASFGISVTPPTSNTSMVAEIDFLVVKNTTKHGND